MVDRRHASGVTAAVERGVAAFLKQQGATDTTLVVGVSGGPDSLCLLLSLVALRTKLGLALHAAHLDHGLRGQEARDDHAAVVALCLEHNVPLISVVADVGTHRRAHKLSLEEAAREVRYAFFARAVKAVKATGVVLGHTADDQAETILMHILRGSGLSGLRGMHAVSIWKPRGTREELCLLRPLLGTTRSETVAYCAAVGVRPRTDSSNASTKHFRNRIRLELLPELQKYNPQIDAALRRLGLVAGEVEDWITRETERTWRGAMRKNPGHIALARKRLGAQPLAIQKALVRKALATLQDELQGIEAEHLEAVLRLNQGPTGKVLHLPGGVRVRAGYEQLEFTRAKTVTAPPILETALPVPGATHIPGWTITARRVKRAVHKPQQGVAYLDPAVAKVGLFVRSRRPGDRFQPSGMKQTKKLQDFLVDAKVPRADRDSLPLVTNGKEILWVVGQRLSERARTQGEAVAVRFSRHATRS